MILKGRNERRQRSGSRDAASCRGGTHVMKVSHLVASLLENDSVLKMKSCDGRRGVFASAPVGEGRRARGARTHDDGRRQVGEEL